MLEKFAVVMQRPRVGMKQIKVLIKQHLTTLTLYEGKSLNNRNFILKCMEKYAQRKILFRDTKWLLSNMSIRGREDQAV